MVRGEYENTLNLEIGHVAFIKIDLAVIWRNDSFKTMQILTKKYVGSWVRSWDALRGTSIGTEEKCLHVLLLSNPLIISLSQVCYYFPIHFLRRLIINIFQTVQGLQVVKLSL